MTRQGNTAYLLDERGRLLILDMETYKFKEEVLEQGGSIVLTGYLS